MARFSLGFLRSAGAIINAARSWNPEIAGDLPAEISFASGGTTTVSTTTDGATSWDQETKVGEIPYVGMRREENLLPDLSVSIVSVTDNGGGSYTFSSSASARVYIDSVPAQVVGTVLGFRVTLSVASGTADARLVFDLGTNFIAPVTVTTTPQSFYVEGIVSSGSNLPEVRVQNASVPTGFTIQVDDWSVVQRQQAGAPPQGHVDLNTVYKAAAAGVRYSGTANANSVDGNNIVTDAVGAAIVGGGVLVDDADSLSLLGWIPAAPYSVVIDQTAPDTLDADNRILSLNTAGANDLTSDASGNVTLVADDNLSIALPGTLSAGDRDKFALTYEENASGLSGSGFTATNDTSVAVNANAEGNIVLGGSGPIIVHKISVYELPALTEPERESAVGN